MSKPDNFIKIGERRIIKRGETTTITLPKHAAKPGEEFDVYKDPDGNIYMGKKP